MHSTFILQTIFITYAFCNSFYSTVTVHATIIVYMPLQYNSSLAPTHITGIATNVGATYRYVNILPFMPTESKTNATCNRNVTKARANAQPKTISHMVSQPLTTCLVSSRSSPLPCSREGDQTGSCGAQQGPNWGFGSGELIGVVQTLFQILTLPPIAMHFMIHGRRHGP
jgi:hypothetical protein